MKKLFLTILLILFSYSSVNASTQGKIFIEINESGNACTTKVVERNISGKNVKQATLHNGSDVTDYVKEVLEDEKEKFSFEIDDSFCFEDCKPDEHPHVQIEYIFNLPPTIVLEFPENSSVLKESEIPFQWQGKDPDGKFLEYKLEISKDNNSFENDTFVSNWSVENFREETLEDGKYFWRVFVRDNSFLNNVVESEIYSFDVDTFVREISKPVIVDPEDGLKTKRTEGTLTVETDDDVTNYVYLNDVLIEENEKSEFQVRVQLEDEGKHIIRVVSKDGEVFAEESITIFANWTPPSNPVFEMKMDEENILLKIENDDYEKAYIFFDGKIIKEAQQEDGWIDLGDEIVGEIKIGVMLEDEYGNQSETIYEILEIDEDLLGIGAIRHDPNLPSIPNPSVCHYKYNSTQGRFTARWCNVTAPRVVKVEQTTRDSRAFTTKVYGVYNPHMLIIIDEYECTLPVVCRERFVKRTREMQEPTTGISIFLNGDFQRSDKFNRKNKYAFTGEYTTRRDIRGTQVQLRYFTHNNFIHERARSIIFFNSPFSNTRSVPKAKNTGSSSQAIFRFPFSRHIGVTQWHGYTAFQSPHTGIDFGSYREPVYAVGDGTIRAAQWDNYSGECLSGGYFVRIEHDNGMNSVYLHLENYRKRNGRNWRVGERVRRGDLIGISGNTGAYNCQPLGYHLHFELRRDRFQRNHVNPVPYIAVDWNRIPTLQHELYPGRLTGNNPHPTW